MGEFDTRASKFVIYVFCILYSPFSDVMFSAREIQFNWEINENKNIPGKC